MFVEQDEYLAIKHEIVPYADHFPFAAAGVPGVYLGRSNCASGRFFHHRPDDTVSRISIPLCTKLIQVGCLSLFALANSETLPFQPIIAEESRAEIEKLWQEIFGGWEGFI